MIDDFFPWLTSLFEERIKKALERFGVNKTLSKFLAFIIVFLTLGFCLFSCVLFIVVIF
jgi:hypothetical protein